MDQVEHKEEYIRIFLALLSSNNSCSLQVDEQSKAAHGLSACCHHSTIISPKGKKGGKGLSEETEPLRPKGKPEKAHLSKVFPLEGRQLKKIKKWDCWWNNSFPFSTLTVAQVKKNVCSQSWYKKKKKKMVGLPTMRTSVNNNEKKTPDCPASVG